MESTIDSITTRPKLTAVCPLITRLEANSKPPSNGAVCALFREGNDPKTRIAASWGGVLHLGTEIVEEKPPARQFLVARNRKTGFVRLVEVSSARLRPVFKRSILSVESSDRIDQNEPRVAEKFGSKRQKRAFEQLKKNKIDMDTLKEQLQTTVLTLDVGDTLNNSTNAAEIDTPDKYLPPIDRDVTDPHKVYAFDKILSEKEKESLSSAVRLVLENDLESLGLSDYTREFISGTRLADDECRMALLYADSILNYLVCDYKKASTVNVTVCSYSRLINDNVLNNFSIRTDKGRTRPQSTKDKAICYIIVLLLIASKLTIPDSKQLQKTLRITMPKLTQLVKVTGARLINADQSSKIVLKLPLAKPPTLRVKKDKK